MLFIAKAIFAELLIAVSGIAKKCIKVQVTKTMQSALFNQILYFNY
jgi:hypothetical protein